MQHFHFFQNLQRNPLRYCSIHPRGTLKTQFFLRHIAFSNASDVHYCNAFSKFGTYIELVIRCRILKGKGV